MHRRLLLKALLVVTTGYNLSGCSPLPSRQSRKFKATKAIVHNRGRAPDAFLNQLINWAKNAPDDIFLVNDKHDIYQQVHKELSPWNNLTHRKAVMLEVMRVLAGFESSWNWRAGIDITNPNSKTVCTEEAGIFQTSANSLNFDADLKRRLRWITGKTDCRTFIQTTKSNPLYALEHTARLLRLTVEHHGPVKNKNINRWLNKASVAEFETFLMR